MLIMIFDNRIHLVGNVCLLLFLNSFGSCLKFFVHKMFGFFEHMGGILNILNFFFVIGNVLF